MLSFGFVDRLDFFAGSGPFVLTPFLVLAPFVVVFALHWYATDGRRKVGPRSGPQIFALVMIWLLFCAAVLSLFFAKTDLAVTRLILLLILATTCLSLVYLIQRSEEFAAVRAGAIAGLVVYLIFDLYQHLLFARHGIAGPEWSGVVNTHLSPYGEGVIRYTGGSADPNRGSMAIGLLVYLSLVDPVTSKLSRWGTPVVLLLGTLLSLATLSRSGNVVFAILAIAAAMKVSNRLSEQQKISLYVVAASTGLWLFTGPVLSALGRSDSLASQRLRLSEGSAASHFALIEKGWLLGTSDFHVLTGRGYGESFVYLQEFFPGNPYGNFHSLYITLLVEVGIVGLVATCLLLIGPLFGRRWHLALALIFFNVFYQSLSDPVFWLALGFMWFMPDGRGGVSASVGNRVALGTASCSTTADRQGR